MAYQNVGTPRFYIDQAEYLKSIGFDFQEVVENLDIESEIFLTGGSADNVQIFSIISHPELFGLDPTNRKVLTYTGTGNSAIANYVYCPTGYLKEQNLEGDNIGRYFALLNHSKESTSRLEVDFQWADLEAPLTTNTEELSILNYNKAGCSIWELEKNPSNDAYSFNPTEPFNMAAFRLTRSGYTYMDEPAIGSISWGVYYDMPNSPDLDLTLDIEFTGAKSVDTLGGSTLTNTRYTGSPWWYDADGNKVEPWSVGETSGTSKRNGRRVWKLSFSYISDENLFASNFMSNNYLETSADNSNYNSNDLTSDSNNFEYTLEDDNSFIAQVLNKVSNGQRFIFQPDNTNNNPDQFAIAMLDMTTFSIKQTAFKTYEIEMDIREVW